MAGIFDEIVDRSNTGSLKWDVNKGELPMWVADMDFRTAPCITEAFVKRARHGIYGYTLITDEWYEAYMSWWKNRHGFAIERDWLVFCTGVVPAISSIVRKLTTVGENVVVMTPVYNIFFNSIINNGRKVLESKLIYKDGELNAYLWENRVYADEFISREIPSLFTVKGEATYLLWIDCTQMSGLPQRLGRYVRETSGLYLSDGRAYRNGEGFLRMNLACPRALLEDGLNRLKESMTGKEVC